MAYYASPPRSPYAPHPTYWTSSTVSSLASTMSAPSPPPPHGPSATYSPPKFRTFQERKREKERAMVDLVGGEVFQPRYTTQQPTTNPTFPASPSAPLIAHATAPPGSQFPLHHRQSLQSIPLHLLAQNRPQAPGKPTPPPRRRESIDVLHQGWKSASPAPESPRRPLPSPGSPGSPVATASPAPRRALPRPGSISSMPPHPLPDSPGDSLRTRTASLPLGTATPSVMPYPYNTLHQSHSSPAASTDMGPAVPSSPTAIRAATLPVNASRDSAIAYAAEQATLRRGQSETTGRSGRRPLPKPAGSSATPSTETSSTTGVGRRQSMPLFRLSGIPEMQPVPPSVSPTTHTTSAGPPAPAPQGTIPSAPVAPSIPDIILPGQAEAPTQAEAPSAVPSIVLPGDDVVSAQPSASSVLPKPGNQSSSRRVPSVTITSIPVINFPDEGDADIAQTAGNTPPTRAPSPSFTFSATPAIQVSSGDTPAIEIPSFSFSDSVGPTIPSFSFPEEETAITDQPAPASSASSSGGLFCGACDGAIIGRIVSAMDRRWHPDCFKCETCKMPLEHVSSYEHDGKAYCHMDYHDQFAPKCHHCATAIVDSRFVTINDATLGQRYYHELHFFCAECGDPFLEPSKSSAAGTEVLRAATEQDAEEDQTKEFVIHGKYAFCEECHVKLHKPKCKGCRKPIRDVAVAALGTKWHKECFRCSHCDGPFPHDNFFPIDGKALCQDCYTSTL